MFGVVPSAVRLPPNPCRRLGRDGPAADHNALSLAEYKSTWSLDESSNTHFHVKLGAPRIKALCNQEVVLYFTLDEILFYESKDFTV